MDTPGNVLKSERERQQKALKDVARKLKINIKYLEAIEDDDYSVLPAEVFARSYLRLYADELDLDSSKLLALFENMRKEPAAEEPEPQEQTSPPPPSEERRKKSFTPFLMIAAAGLIIVILVLMSQNREQDRGKRIPVDRKAAVHETEQADMEKELPSVTAPPSGTRTRVKDTERVVKPAVPPVNDEEKRTAAPVPVPRKEMPAPERASILDEEKGAAVEPQPPPDRKEPVDTAPVPAPLFEKADGEMTLGIVATELTWVSVSVDGGKPREWHLRPGQTITLKGHIGFRGKVGNAGGTKLYFNDKDLGDLGPSGQIIDIALPR